jgi:cytoskeletal protein CcmA (bactofilin family)
MFSKKSAAPAAQPLFDKDFDSKPPEKAATPVPANTPSPAPAKESSMAQKPVSPAPAFRPDLGRRPEQAMSPMGGQNSMQGMGPNKPGVNGRPEEMRKLTVGRDIALTGEISACDYLIVEGTVEARVREGKRMEIADCGLFRGTVEIDEADIAGRFEGDITVHGRLRVRATGRIDGKVQYGELEVEAGGHIEGELHSTKGKAAAAAAAPLKPRSTDLSEAPKVNEAVNA